MTDSCNSYNYKGYERQCAVIFSVSQEVPREAFDFFHNHIADNAPITFETLDRK